MSDAHYLQFKDNAVRTDSAVLVDLEHYQPSPGEILIEWQIQNDDRIPSNYRRNGYFIVYDPPAPPVVANRPDADAMLTAIWDDPIWQSVPQARPIRPQLAAMKDVLKIYIQRGEIERVYEAWEDMKFGIPAPIAQLVEGYAAAFNVPLVRP